MRKEALNFVLSFISGLANDAGCAVPAQPTEPRCGSSKDSKWNSVAGVGFRTDSEPEPNPNRTQCPVRGSGFGGLVKGSNMFEPILLGTLFSFQNSMN